VTPAMSLRLDDDDDTIPTENSRVIADLTATLVASPLTVLEWGSASSAGVRRRVNEDAWGQRADTFIVADGMGGRGGGALAARTAIDRFLARLDEAGAHPDWRRIVESVNSDVIHAGRERGVDRLGTTLLVAVVGGPLITLIHLGDSRAYRLANVDDRPRLDQLTHDHNVRAELLAAGLDIGEYRDRGVALHGLTSFIGLELEALRVDVLAIPVRAGDRLLLCTDGVHRQLDDDQIRAMLCRPSCQDAADRLVERADDVGGRDNATAVVLRLGVS
jgi:serine/threonine protein phosphatase PrpC